jgi:hypothetical protein
MKETLRFIAIMGIISIIFNCYNETTAAITALCLIGWLFYPRESKSYNHEED